MACKGHLQRHGLLQSMASASSRHPCQVVQRSMQGRERAASGMMRMLAGSARLPAAPYCDRGGACIAA